MLRQKTNHRESEQVSTRLSPNEIRKIDELVRMGYSLNTSDFVRMAVREKLHGITLVEGRRPNQKEARTEILSYLDQHGQACASDIASDLGLDIDLVFSILRELQEGGEVA